MTRISNKYPALRRAQEWLAAHGDPLPEPGTQPKPAKDKSRAAKSGSGPRTGIPVRDSCVPDESAGRDSRAIPGHQPLPTSHPPLDLSRHERRCSICQHPERDAIEEAFLDWRSISQIAHDWNLPGRTALYRHAHAFGLFPRRSRNLRAALGMIIEKSEWATVTAESIVSAVRAYTRVTDAGEWVEPPTHVIVSSGTRLAERSPAYARRITGRRAKALAPAPHESPVTTPESPLLTATHPRTENDATR